jgi:putative addiction module antidote
MTKLKLTSIGTSTGCILPIEVLNRLKVVKGDSLFLTESQDGFRLTPYDPQFSEEMALAQKVMHDRKDLLHELAK